MALSSRLPKTSSMVAISTGPLGVVDVFSLDEIAGRPYWVYWAPLSALAGEPLLGAASVGD